MTQIRRPRAARALFAIVAIVAMCGTPGSAAVPLVDKLDSALRAVLDNPLGSLTKVRVIVSARPGQLSSLVLTLRLGGLPILGEHPLIEAVTIEAPRLVVATLSTLSLVQSISLDAPVLALTDPGGATTGERLRGTIGLAGTGYTGAGIGVAVIDSGIHPSPALQSRIAAFYDFTGTGKPVAKAPYDDYGHGTHVAGLIG
jgi:serine protease AprX